MGQLVEGMKPEEARGFASDVQALTQMLLDGFDQKAAKVLVAGELVGEGLRLTGTPLFRARMATSLWS